MKQIFILINLVFIYHITNSQIQTVNTSTSEFLNYLSIIDNNILVGGKNAYIAKSNDECNNLSSINSPASSGDWCELHRIDTNTLFIFSHSGSKTIIYKSTNGGNSWVQKLNSDTVLGNEFTMLDSLEGIILCFSHNIMRTSDGGDTWVLEYSPIYNPIKIATFGDSIVGTGLFENFGISKDRGHNWQFSTSSFPSGAYQRNIFFLSKDTILSVSISNAGNQLMSFSTNQGITWKHKYFANPPYFDPYDLYFFNINEGYAVGYNGSKGVIYKTKDTGNTWSIYETQIPSIFGRIEFINDSIALIAGSNGVLLKWNKNSYATEAIDLNNISSNISIYPNPSNNSQTISITTENKSEEIKIQLTDITGKVLKDVYRGNSLNGQCKINSEINNLSKGIYFYKIRVGDKLKFYKFIKE